MINRLESAWTALALSSLAPAALATPAGNETGWKDQVAKAIIEGRCDDAKAIALAANPSDVAQQVLGPCGRDLNASADRASPNLKVFKNVDKLINSETDKKDAYTGQDIFGFDEPTQDLELLSNGIDLNITVSILGSTFWLQEVDRKKAPLVQTCKTPCFVKIPLAHEFKVQFETPAGWKIDSKSKTPEWKYKIFFTGLHLEPSFIRVNLIPDPTQK
jgi:hypothetical protein